MGTNYYMHLKPPCCACGHTPPESTLHIGKSSAGRPFLLHVIPELGLNSAADWIALWKSEGVNLSIRNEYWGQTTLDEMVSKIDSHTLTSGAFS